MLLVAVGRLDRRDRRGAAPRPLDRAPDRAPAPGVVARSRDGDLSARAPEEGPAELAELAASFNEMAANLESLFDARRQLVAWASHDLRAPLASMQAMIEALEDGLAEPERYLPAMREQVRTLGRPRRRPVRARAHRRGRAHARAPRRAARRPRRVVPARRRGRGRGAADQARSADRRRRSPRALRAGQGRARAPQPADERPSPHAVGRRGRRASSSPLAAEVRVTVEDTGEGLPAGGRATSVRPLLARRPRPNAGPRRSGPRARDRPRPRRGTGRPDLGREPRRAAAPGSASRCPRPDHVRHRRSLPTGAGASRSRACRSDRGRTALRPAG